MGQKALGTPLYNMVTMYKNTVYLTKLRGLGMFPQGMTNV